MPTPSEMTSAELRERLNQVSVTVQRIRFQDSREAYYHAKRWASEQNKPIRQELKRREKTGASSSSFRMADGAGLGDSAPDAEPRSMMHPSCNKGWGRMRSAYWNGDMNDLLG